MKYGVYLPNFDDYFDARFMAQLAAEAEQAGWDGFFIWDHIIHPYKREAPFADPWIQLAAIALATQRLTLGAMVTPISRRRPWKLAKETVTLDHLSNGRLVFGAGLGSHAVELADLGEESDPYVRAKMLDEGLAVLDGLWSGKDFEFQGEYYRVARTRFMPPALQQPRIPVWVAGIWPNPAPLARAARWDGYFPIKRSREERFLSPEEIAKALVAIKGLRQSQAHFDMISSGYTSGANTPQELDKVEAYQKAGATWYLEALDPYRCSSEEARGRISQGPPRV